jgi:rubredoxin
MYKKNLDRCPQTASGKHYFMNTWVQLRDIDRGHAPPGTKQCRACWFVDDTRQDGDELDDLDGAEYFKKYRERQLTPVKKKDPVKPKNDDPGWI